MKRIYEAPSVRLVSLMAQEDLLTNPTVSDTGFGYDDQGPVQNIDPVS